MADWTKYPMNASVNWPNDEKIIGVLGLAPVATADFIDKLVSRPLRKDWECPKIIMNLDSKIPSRGRFFELNETDPVPYIMDGIKDLASAGADFVVIPCNTAHILYERFAKDSPVPIPHIVDVTCAYAKKRGVSAPLLLCSRAVREHGLYEKICSCVQFPNGDLVSAGIEAVKQNKDTADIAAQIRKDIAGMPDVDGVIYGCTEIGLLMESQHDETKRVIDSNQALADFCFEFANGNVEDNIRISV